MKTSDNNEAKARPEVHIPVVGIGASAGGLEALDLFLRHVPGDSGMAFVIIQHLDPTHKGIMAELLQRTTTLHVFQVKDRMKIQPGCVYVIPPNKLMSILNGALYLLEAVTPRGLPLPIDFFFRSLAEDQAEKSIGVILSGMGTDGTAGMRAIKEKGGLALVQEPASAKFDSMPTSVIIAGLADVVAPAEELPARIAAFLQHTLVIKSGPSLEIKTQSGLEKAIILLRAHTGHDFSSYKKNTLYRRIERRMALHQVDKISTYVRYLQVNPQELDLLFKELLIGVTGFFRDPEAWDTLKTKVLPELLKNQPAGRTLRAWVVGCSTGEEAYSLAIAFIEALELGMPYSHYALQIYATDLDRDAIDKARKGVYPANISADVSPQRLERFFIKVEKGYQVKQEIREMVIFAPQNVISDPPFTRLDILTCRNLLIYLEAELQQKLLGVFHYSLNPGGLLFLGNSETIGTLTALFAILDRKARLFQRLGSTTVSQAIEFPISIFTPASSGVQKGLNVMKPEINLQSLADQLILQHHSPAAVLVNSSGDILYINGRTGRYLEPAAGKANWNIYAMARPELTYELGAAFHRVLRQKVPVTLQNLKVGTNGGVQVIDLTIQPVEEPEALKGLFLIVFKEAAALPKTELPGEDAAAARPAEIIALEQELQQNRQELQTTREEMQTSQEELRSANEELQSANEELQATNEELTTSREEMQSLNEELQTVNVELQSRVDDLSHVNNDMKNLLDSTEIATVFLDDHLRVRRFTPQVTRFIKLIPGDVGRPFTDIVSTLAYPDLLEDVQEVLRKLLFLEKQIAAKDGRWFNVRIMPYRTLENKIDGVVITFMDITAFKKLEAELRGREGPNE